MTNKNPYDTFTHLRYLWRHFTPFDLLHLSNNEGSGFGGNLNLCFAGEQSAKEATVMQGRQKTDFLTFQQRLAISAT